MTLNSRPLCQFLLLFVILPLAAAGQAKKDPSLLTVDRIFGSSEFRGQRFAADWRSDSSGYLTLEKSKAAEGRDIVLYTPAGKRSILVSASELIPHGRTAPLTIDGYAFSSNEEWVLIYTNSKRVWRRNTRGDYWLLDRSGRELRQIGGNAPASTLMFAKFSPDGRQVAYVRDRDIYVESLRDRTIRRLTRRKSDEIINGTFDWVYEEELGLRDGFRWSPDSKHIAYWQLDTSKVRGFSLINNTQGLYPKVVRFKYPKVGQLNSSCRVGVMGIQDSALKTHWVDMPGDPREHYLARMEWVGPSELILQQLNRRQNTNRVFTANFRVGTPRLILTERDDAWVNIHDELHWIGNDEFTWVSERSGWRHLYTAKREAAEPWPVTSGNFDVIRVLHADKQLAYFLASPNNATQRYLYRVDIAGGKAVRVTPATHPGTHNYQISPNGKWAIHSYSSFDQPTVTELVSLPNHKTVRTLADNNKLKAKIDQLKRSPTEFFQIEINNGVSLDAWCIKPPDFDAKKKYPLLVYVYGEPAGQTVLDRWGGSRYLWHLMLAQQGYIVMSFDNRGTPAPKGRTWRKCVYKQVGVLAPEEQAAAVRKVLAKRPYLDRERVGVWGWSGGGSMSLNAIFKFPDLYHTAIAIAPVPNQRYYDTIYQERYMGLPKDNVEGFLRGSPINYAKQLKGNLLLIHGTGDDNCHYQTMEMLINELILHNKPFSMMAYPNRTHSIREGKNTTLHLRHLMTRYLQRNLPSGDTTKGKASLPQ